MSRTICLVAIIMAGVSAATCQSSGPKKIADQAAGSVELNTKEASRVTLQPPKEVRVKLKGDSVVVEWAPSTQKRVVEYKVFRIDENDDKVTMIGRTKGTSFVVEKVKGMPSFAVAAVDYRGNEGAVSPSVKTQRSGSAK